MSAVLVKALPVQSAVEHTLATLYREIDELKPVRAVFEHAEREREAVIVRIAEQALTVARVAESLANDERACADADLDVVDQALTASDAVLAKLNTEASSKRARLDARRKLLTEAEIEARRLASLRDELDAELRSRRSQVQALATREAAARMLEAVREVPLDRFDIRRVLECADRALFA
ncbi:MAG: hypothetical protein AB7P21_00205 [Lautropia sp.]